jgi:hypothetical protein
VWGSASRGSRAWFNGAGRGFKDGWGNLKQVVSVTPDMKQGGVKTHVMLSSSLKGE